MKNDMLKIPVAAPDAGLQYQIVSEKTEWQRFSDSLPKATPRLFYPPRTEPNPQIADVHQERLRHIPYVRPKRPDELSRMSNGR